MEEDLKALLVASAAITALVPASQINWGASSGYPRIVLNRISGAQGLTMKGPDGLETALVQIDCYALSTKAAKQVSRAVIARLDGYRGAGFRGVFRQNTRDGREGGSNEAERPFRVSLDFTVNWRA
jgi:hypothetical protein